MFGIVVAKTKSKPVKQLAGFTHATKREGEPLYIRDPRKVAEARDRLTLQNLARDLDPRLDDLDTQVAHTAIINAIQALNNGVKQLSDAA